MKKLSETEKEWLNQLASEYLSGYLNDKGKDKLLELLLRKDYNRDSSEENKSEM